MKARPYHAVLGMLAVLAVTPAPSRAQQDAAPVQAAPPSRQTPVEGRDYRVYTRDGAATSLAAIFEAMDPAEVVLVGEEHGDTVGHRLEAALLTGALERYRGTPRWVMLSLEMFERDVQYVLDEYLTGLIAEAHFLDSARPWEEYAMRYRPLVETARAWRIPVVAANAPRRYVNRVTREGPGSLADLGPLAKHYLPPLPYPGPSDRYRAQWDALMSGQDHGVDLGENALQAQALWDASMGHAVVEALGRGPDRFVIHVAGSFHVERGTGVPERIEDLRPGTRIVSVVMRRTDSPAAWDPEAHTDLGDFVILTR